MSKNKKALGRGLDALLGNSEADYSRQRIGQEQVGQSPKVNAVGNIPVSQIEANPFQPRNEFEKEALLELTDSIKELGLIQPVTVRMIDEGKYQLISGERRLRASQAAGLEEIPAYIRVANDQSMLEMALVENIQRRDLNAVEVALSYKRLIEECDLTQEKLASRVGKKRSSISNFLRILNLPAEVQNAIIEEKISFGHARALSALNDEDVQLYLLDLIISEAFSVRQAEEWVKESKKQDRQGSKKSTAKTNKDLLSFEHQRILDELKDRFNKKVKLSVNEKGKGKIVISFDSDSELEALVNSLH